MSDEMISQSDERYVYRAFTLIELLVVISIIALLIALLLPGLSVARETGRKGVCLAHQRQAGMGLQNYAVENDDWIPGPNTSGFDLKNGGDPGNRSDSPTMGNDWFSPSMGPALNLPEPGPNWKDDILPQRRLKAIFENNFSCPSNNETYSNAEGGPQKLDGTPVTEIKTASYGSPLAFHLWPETLDRRYLSTLNTKNFPGRYTGYRPRLSLIKRAELKGATLDGTRFVRGADETISFKWERSSNSGGTFMVMGPTTNEGDSTGGDPHTLGLGSLSQIEEKRSTIERFAYRHQRGMVVSFYDGHAMWMDQDESRKVKYWFPTGTQLVRMTLDPDRPTEVH